MAFALTNYVAPRIADVTMAQALSGEPVTVTLNILTPLQRGRLIAKEQNIRNASTRAFDGPVLFDPPFNSIDDYARRIEHLVCWHPSRNTRAAACGILGVRPFEVAADLADIELSIPGFASACLSLDVDAAWALLDSSDATAFDIEDARFSLENFEVVFQAFQVQRAAAFGWRMLKSPFDGLLGEMNASEGGYASVSSVLAHLNERRQHIVKLLVHFDSGCDDVKRKHFAFLRKYGLKDLLDKQVERALIAYLGEERVRKLLKRLAELRESDENSQRILATLGNDGICHVPLVEQSRKKLQTVIFADSPIVVLAMKCARLAALANEEPLGEDEVPAWLRNTAKRNEENADAKSTFVRIFQFYRGVFCPDGMKTDRDAVEAFIRGGAWDAKLKTDTDRTCRVPISEMKKRARNDATWLNGPQHSQAWATGLRAIWSEAA